MRVCVFYGRSGIRTHVGVNPNGFQDFSRHRNISPDRGFCETLSDADFSRVIEEIGVFQ